MENVKKLLHLRMQTKDDFRERRKLCYNGWFYAIQRMDLLIISISGAGVLVILETLKFSTTTPIGDVSVLKYSGALFIISIIINFISQITGKKSNYWDMINCDAKIRAADPPTSDELIEITQYDCKAECFSVWTDKLNSASIFTMCIALVALLSFFWFTF